MSRNRKPAAGSTREQEEIVKIAAAKKGHYYIRLRCWTEANQSSIETAAKSITAAVRFVRLYSLYHANWSMEFRSETNAPAEEANHE